MTDSQICKACGYHVHFDGTVSLIEGGLDDFTIWDSVKHCVDDNGLRLSDKQIRNALKWYQRNVDLDAIARHFNITVNVLTINMRLS